MQYSLNDFVWLLNLRFKSVSRFICNFFFVACLVGRDLYFISDACGLSLSNVCPVSAW